MKTTLALDLGTNSIGWALLESAENGTPTRIIDAGARIFIKAVEDKTPTPKNVARRNARLARRLIQRRARRRKKLLNLLIEHHLLPTQVNLDSQSREQELNLIGDPYQLRAKALDTPLKPHELGRVLYHLSARRGFLSNRKIFMGDLLDDPDAQDLLPELDQSDDAEETAFKKDISELRNQIKKSGARTLGEYLSQRPEHQCKRNRQHQGGLLRTDRKMYQEEFNLIKSVQKQHFDLSDDFWSKVEHILFFQRPLKLKKGRIGKCSLEPNRYRCAKARLEFQQFRYWQDINHLTYFEPYTQSDVSLTMEQKQKLAVALETKPRLTWPQTRKLLGLEKSYLFNLEKSGTKDLVGNRTGYAIQQIIGDAWQQLSAPQQTALVEDLLTIKKKTTLKNRLIQYWHLPVEQAIYLASEELEPGHSDLSLKAINKLLPFLKQGQIYSDARISAGYGYETKDIAVFDKLPAPPNLRNPIVNKGLHETRKLINAVIATYGKPDIIRIEMARDLTLSNKDKIRVNKVNRDNLQKNKEAEEQYDITRQSSPHLGLRKYPSKDDKLRYRLWKEQGCRCPYSLKSISLQQVFSAETEIDHILPYSQSLDDSYMNKVLCFADTNRDKGNRTPYEAWSNQSDKWEQLVANMIAIDKENKHTITAKKNRFLTKSTDEIEGMISSQLNDTRYLSREVFHYVKQLGCKVEVSKGILTAKLRHMWGLNHLLGSKDDHKERKDHRHHTIDAIVTALVDHKLYRTLVSLAKEVEKHQNLQWRDLHLDSPLENIQQQTQHILEEMIVSHDVRNKLYDALHEDTGSGFIEGIGTVYRKALNEDNFKTEKQIDSIIDPVVKDAVLTHFNAHNQNAKQAFAPDNPVYHPNGNRIYRIRVQRSKATREQVEQNQYAAKDRFGKTFKYIPYGNMHHVAIYQQDNGKIKATVTPMFKQAEKVRLHKITGSDTSSLIMTLAINDMVELTIDEVPQIYRVQQLESLGNSARLSLRLDSDATTEKNNSVIRKTVPTLIKDYQMQKVTINRLGKRL